MALQVEDFIKDLALGAGRIIKEKYHDVKKWRAKSDPGDIVTEVDEASEKYIIDRIKAAFPNDHILAEESGALGGKNDGRVWIIDPLDGTRNYMTGIPFFCVSIALTVNGEPEVGAIYDPIHDEMFFAKKGGGAYLNGEPISVCGMNSLDESLISVSWVNRKADRKAFIDYIDRISLKTSYFRRLGSAALVMSYVACGRLHAYMQAGLCPWDVAAGIVIIQEAGGLVTDFQGRPIDLHNGELEVLTANPALHKQLSEIINTK